ncbi:MAG: pilus assembly protein [Actinomycetota bacterium]|nr:pilus assembly protein [Actinomycetota bacterium]
MSRPARDEGSAVVEFVLVSMLLVALLMAVLQVAVFVHVRNVIAASAQEGARYGANADVDSAAGAERTRAIVERALSAETSDGLTCTAREEAGEAGAVLVVVRCTGAVPSLFSALGDLLAIDATGRAVKEGR